ncbi:MAG: DUF2953 domain-containing protein [Gammaproteobacteria bacterium]
MGTAAAIVLLLVGILAIPVTLDIRLAWDDRLRDEVTLRWAFGLVRVPIRSRRGRASDADTNKTEKPAKPRGRTKRKRINVIRVLQQKASRRRLFRFLKDLWNAVAKHDVSLRLRLGLDDPADTGLLWSVVGPLSGYLTTLENASILIEPDFFETVLELEGSGKLRVVPLHVIVLVTGLFLSPAIHKSIRQAKTASA